LTITEPTAGKVTFEISNTGPEPATVASVYFDDAIMPLLTDSVTISSSGSGVVFSADKKAKNLPGGSTVSPVFMTDFSFNADPPPSMKGVNPGEFVAFTIDLAASKTFADVASAIGDGSLRIGVHVISINGNENS